MKRGRKRPGDTLSTFEPHAYTTRDRQGKQHGSPCQQPALLKSTSEAHFSCGFLVQGWSLMVSIRRRFGWAFMSGDLSGLSGTTRDNPRPPKPVDKAVTSCSFEEYRCADRDSTEERPDLACKGHRSDRCNWNRISPTRFLPRISSGQASFGSTFFGTRVQSQRSVSQHALGKEVPEKNEGGEQNGLLQWVRLRASLIFCNLSFGWVGLEDGGSLSKEGHRWHPAVLEAQHHVLAGACHKCKTLCHTLPARKSHLNRYSTSDE